MATALNLIDAEAADPLQDGIRRYWNEHIHDLAVAKSPVGSREFFRELDDYRFDKLRYLPRVVDFSAYGGKKILEVGCGLGIDAARFARHGARITGVDLSEQAAALARKNFEQNGLEGDFRVMDGESLDFPDNSFDVVYAHGVLQYTGSPNEMLREIRRVLRPGGEAILMVYNKISWLSALSKLARVPLEHEDAPVLRTFSIREFRRMLRRFAAVRIVVERFPVKSRLHEKGVKGLVFNTLFVGTFNLLPRRLVRPLGWHIMAFVKK